MKKSFTIVALLLCFSLFAQKEVAKKVSALLTQNTTFKPYSFLSVANQISDNGINKLLKKSTLATITLKSLATLRANKEENIEVQIPYQDEIITVQLYKVTLFAEGFHLDSDKAKAISYDQGLYYRGTVKGDSNSIVSFNFFKNEFNGVISNTKFNNLVIGKVDKKDNVSDYIIYSDIDMNVQNNIQCHTKEGAFQPVFNYNKNAKISSQRCVTMYFEIDYNLFLDNGSNTTTTTNWLTSVFNNVQTLYANEGISIALKSLYIWTTPDPYEGIGQESSDYLIKFNEVRPVFDGDVGQLIGEDAGNLGGVAITVNGLCTDNNFSYADATFSYNTVPTFSWTVMVITHEMGHLLGSPHTHACVWNGNDTAIDGCGPTADVKYKEGTCINGPIPSSGVGGTIMSYCHLISGVGINLANGFGPQPAAAILSVVNNSNCLSTDCINTCINTVSEITLTNLVQNTATISWTDIGNTSTWEISVSPFTSSLPIWKTVTTTSFNATNLLPNTYYKIKIRPVCGSGLTAPSRQYIFVTNTNYCNGITITDTGGENGNYSSLERYVRTIIPNAVGKKIRITFSSFDLEDKFDYLYLYDGNSTSVTDLSKGGFTGTTIPGTFESTAADGSLTLEFYSDEYEVGTGYIATIDCTSNLDTATFIPNLDFTYYPNPSNGLVSISSKTVINEVLVYNPQGRLLYQRKINGLEAKVDMASFATGTYFFKLKFNEKEAHFKIVKM